MTNKVRKAAQQALDALLSTNQNNPRTGSAISALRAALAEQPAEPVAWRDPTNSDPGQGCTYDKAVYEKWPHIYKQPLYTAPQSVKQLLTDDEIIRVGINTKSAEPGRDGYVLPVTFARAVIAAYEAKNGITGETK